MIYCSHMSSSLDIEIALGKASTCEICGDDTFMCECKYDVPDYDTYNDTDYE